MPVGSLSAGDGWCGASDMAGNVWEWCNDWYTGLQDASRRTLEASDYAIVDIADGSRSVMYECGYLSAHGVDCLITKSDASQRELPFPDRYADTGDRTVCFYSDLDDLITRCVTTVKQKLVQKARSRRI